MCVLILPTLFVWNILILRRIQRDIIKVYLGFHVKDPLFSSDIGETWIFSEDFEKSSNKKFNENPFGGIWVVPLGRMDGQADRRANVIQVTVAFRRFVQAPENWCTLASFELYHSL